MTRTAATAHRRGACGEALEHASVLLVEDEPATRNLLLKTFRPRCKRVEQASTVQAASDLLDQAHFDLIVLDNDMPAMTGLEWLVEQRRVGLTAKVILTAAQVDTETAIKALRAEVVDFVPKPFRANQVLDAAVRSLGRQRGRGAGEGSAAARGRLLGASPAIRQVREMLTRLAPQPTPVMFTGASGTGKEMAARMLHGLSDRAEQPFVAVNCAAISPDCIAEDLLGPGETRERPTDGLLLQADGGTLLFDEVTLLPLPAQASLLRVLEHGQVCPHGRAREAPLNLRFLFTTNSDLQQAVAEGRFREDLFHRINVINIEMPPLRNRAEDIVELAALFMSELSRSRGLPALEFNDEVLLKLCRYSWPGNVRELRNLIERSVILGAFPDEFAGPGTVTGSEAVEKLALVEQRHILSVLDASGGNRAEAARRLGVSRKTIDRKCAAWAKKGGGDR